MDVYAGVAGGCLQSVEVTADDAYAGAFVQPFLPGPGLVRVGQELSGDGSELSVYQAFLSFDLSGVSDVGQAQLSIWVAQLWGGVPYAVLAAPYAFAGAAPTIADWRDLADLAALSVVAQLTPATQGAYGTFAGDLASVLVPDAVNRLVLFTDGNRSATVPPAGGKPWADLARTDPAHPARLTIAPAVVVEPGGPIPVYVSVADVRQATGAAAGAAWDDRLTTCAILGSRYVDGVTGEPVADESASMPPYEVAVVPCPPAWRLAALAAAVRYTKSPDLPFGAVGGLGDAAVYVRGTSIPEVDLILTGHRTSWGIA